MKKWIVGIAALNSDKNILYAVKTTAREEEQAEPRYVWCLIQEIHIKKFLKFHNLVYSRSYKDSRKSKKQDEPVLRKQPKFHKFSWSNLLNDLDYRESYKFIPDNNSDDPECLNLWSGLAINYAKVIQNTNWFKIRVILNHIKYTWANNDAEYFQILKRLATVVCRPWLKTEVAMAIGGKCHVFSSWFTCTIGVMI